MSGPAFWLCLSGWLVAGIHGAWIHRDALLSWLENLLDTPPPPAPRPPAQQHHHVRVIDDREVAA